MVINLLDRKILHILDGNARMPLSSISKKLRQSREKIAYRIRNMEKKGVIRKYVTMIDPSKLGYSVYKIFIKFQNLSKKIEKDIYSWLTKNNFVYWVASAYGDWDLNATIFAKDIYHYETIMEYFFNAYGKYIQDQEFNTTLQVGILSKDWLLPTKTYGDVTLFFGDTKDLDLDQLDIKLLRILANHARMSAVEISKKLSATQRMVIYRIKELEKKGIILGYTTSINLEKIDMQFFKATVSFNVLTSSVKKKIIEYCKHESAIGFFVFCVGGWSLELELIVKNNTEFYNVMGRFREQFPEIKSHGTILFSNEYKFDWMPLCYSSTDK